MHRPENYSLNKFIFVIAILIPWLAFGQQEGPSVPKDESPTVRVKAKPSLVDGRLVISGEVQWTPPSGQDVCILLPLNQTDRAEWKAINQHIKMMYHRTQKAVRSDHSIELIEAPDHLEKISDALYRMRSPGSSLTLRFEAVSGKSGDPDARFISDFHPIPLRSCPLSENRVHRYRQLNFELDLEPLPDHSSLPKATRFAAPSLSLAFLKGYQHQELTLLGLDVDLYYQSQDFELLKETLEVTLRSHKSWLGNYPYDSLALIETKALESFLMPGIITMNKPRQSFFETLQRDWLNWSHWALTTLLAYQWLIPGIQSASPDDLWFFQGLSDFVTGEALQKNLYRYNLFNVFDLGFSVMSMNYRELQNLSAALLEKYAPLSRLTSSQFDSVVGVQDQHPLLFIRHTMTLRHLMAIAGEEGMKRFLRIFAKVLDHKSFTPKLFMDQLASLPSPFPPLTRKKLKETTAQWWTQSGWPDYEFLDYKTTRLQDGRYLVDVSIQAHGDFSFPVDFQVQDEKGYTRTGKARLAGKDLKGSTITHFAPDEIEVDQKRTIFDRDRYNNSNRVPDVEFFPGNAKTIRDDTYSVLWFPYLQKRPGEDLALGIQALLFKFIQGELSLRVESEMSGRKGVHILKHHAIPSLAMTLQTDFSQNFEGFREVKASLKKSSLFGQSSNVNGGLMLRERRIVGQKDTAHGTFAFSLSLKPGFQKSGCQTRIKAEHETAPKLDSTEISYNRLVAYASSLCPLFAKSLVGLRLFLGDLYNESDALPQNVLFKPNDLGEAHIRVDQTRGLRPKRIRSVTSDLYFPFALPLPGDALLIHNQLKWRVFYDWGIDQDTKETFESGGVGLFMPFGGDVVGGGSLSLFRLSLLVVLHSKVGGEASTEPAILFDISGDL